MKKKTKSSLALNPDEFEKENLRVERDACRMEISKLATEKKDLGDTVEILTTRCRLLENERNTAATKNAAPKAVPDKIELGNIFRILFTYFFRGNKHNHAFTL